MGAFAGALAGVLIFALVATLVVGGLIVGGVVWGIGQAAGWGKKKHELQEPPQPRELPRTYEYLDADADITPDTVLDVVHGYASDSVLGGYAQGVEITMSKAKYRRQALFAVLDREFERDTITFDKFSAPIEVALDGIWDNSVQLANRMQAFDAPEYQRLQRLVAGGACEQGTTKWEQWELLQHQVEEMNALQEANDRLLLELDKLQAELDRMESANPDETTEQIAEEIRALVEDAKYYS